MTVIGHGSDGCSFSLFVEDADENTKLIAINSELVCTRTAEKVRSYVLMGDEVNTEKVHPAAELVLYNSAFWGSPVIGCNHKQWYCSFSAGQTCQRSGCSGYRQQGGRCACVHFLFCTPNAGRSYRRQCVYKVTCNRCCNRVDQ